MFLLLWICLAGLPQSDAQTLSAAPADNHKYEVEGTVINSITGEPIAHALVTTTHHAMLTGSDGRFHFSGIPGPRASVEVEKPGFVDQRLVRILFASINGEIDEPIPQGFLAIFDVISRENLEAGPLVLKLIPESVIAGHVQDSNGRPVRGARIQLELPSIDNGSKNWETQTTVVSDEEGNFRIAEFLPSTFYLSVQPDREGFSLEKVAQSARPGVPALIYYPASPGRQSALPLKITPGQVLDLRFILKVQPLFRISGKISGPAARTNFLLRLVTSEGAEFPMQSSILPNGDFELRRIPAGMYRLQVVGQAHAEVALNVTHNMEGVRLHVLPKVVIPVGVTGGPEMPKPSSSSSDGELVLHAGESTVHLLSGPVDVFLQPVEGDNSISARLERDNGVDVIKPFPGKYRASIRSLSDQYYVESARRGGADLLHEDLVVEPGPQAEPIEISLRNDGATLTVNAAGARDSSQFEVLLVPQDASADIIRATRNPPEQLTISNIPPGDYQVYAFYSIEQLEFRKPEVLKQYSAKAVRITLNAQQKKDLTVELIRREEYGPLSMSH